MTKNKNIFSQGTGMAWVLLFLCSLNVQAVESSQDMQQNEGSKFSKSESAKSLSNQDADCLLSQETDTKKLDQLDTNYVKFF